jgi:hypothetical protein
MTMCSAPPTFLRVSSARAALRACRTTLCPCSISSSAAILPRPSAEPVTKTRVILKISLAVADIGFKNGPFETTVMAIASAPRFAVYDKCPIHRITAPPDVHNVHPKPANDRNAAAAATARRRPSS